MNRYFLFVPLLAFCTDGRTSAISQSNEEDNGVEQVVKIPPVPAKLSFAGEQVPLKYMDVRESLQREMMVITYWHASLTYILQLNNRYEAIIKGILKEEGLSEDFYYLCIAESGLQPVVSSAGAGGYWQFLSSTAKEYGLVVNDEVDERYNIEKSTRAAAAYFKKAYGELGTWTMAAASFNIGLSNVRYRMDIQFQKNYYDTQFPEETSRYLFRALAFKTILADPQTYGFRIEKDQLYQPLEYTEVTVDGPVKNWSTFATKYKTNFKLLKMYNQWIRANTLENKEGKSYIVKVPKEGSR
ncbi:MAG: lytic transglycosylase domain-containing protein [Bacteroidales bacterium]